MEVDLFYLSPNPYGGWVTYTSHLMKSLRMVGVTPNLFKIRERSENKYRQFGYDERYLNITLKDAQKRHNPKLIVAAAKKFKEQTDTLWKLGAGLVIHDPTELKNLPPDVHLSKAVIVVRKSGTEHLPNATFIRHPYVRVQEPELPLRERHAISVSRVDFDKHTDILLDANRLLPEAKRITIRGFENRIYTRFKIVPNYPEWVQSKGHFPRGQNEAFRLLEEYKFHIDMSEIKGDGGGTQYTFLEAWDAGCLNIINAAWIRENDDMKPHINCLSVKDVGQLAMILSMDWHEDDLSAFRTKGYAQLALHHPHVVGEQYKEFIRGLK